MRKLVISDSEIIAIITSDGQETKLEFCLNDVKNDIERWVEQGVSYVNSNRHYRWVEPTEPDFLERVAYRALCYGFYVEIRITNEHS